MEITYDLAATAADEAGLDAENVSPYSGRGMGNKECMSLRFESDNEVRKFVTELALLVEDTEDRNDPNVEEHIDFWLDNVRHDAMGRRSIAYWPGITLTDVPDHIF